MSGLVDRFQSSLAANGLIPVGSRVLVAVSGGADSVALLLLLQSVSGPLTLHLEAAHMDHGLRPESADDVRFVRELCARFQVPLTVERRDVRALAQACKGNMEEVARKERRAFLEATAQRLGCDRIALGHHRDDQAETVLLRLLRGTGTAGLAGMYLPAGAYVRPLLDFDRADLQAFLNARGIGWREDATNNDLRLTRNRIRHELLPLLQTFNPQIVQRLDDLSRLLADDEAYWEGLLQELLERNLQQESGAFAMPREIFLSAPPALAGRLVRAVLAKARGDLRRIELQHVEQVLALARGGRPQAELHLPAGWVARRYDRLLFAAASPAPDLPSSPVWVETPGIFPLPDGRRLSVTLCEQGLGEGSAAVEFDARAVHLPLQIRTVSPGDRLHPAGMTGRKKLQDLFVDLKLTREQRAVQPLVLCGDKILWVVGLRRCREFLPQGAEQPVLRLELVDTEQLDVEK
mgnify:FL=1